MRREQVGKRAGGGEGEGKTNANTLHKKTQVHLNAILCVSTNNKITLPSRDTKKCKNTVQNYKTSKGRRRAATPQTRDHTVQQYRYRPYRHLHDIPHAVTA